MGARVLFGGGLPPIVAAGAGVLLTLFGLWHYRSLRTRLSAPKAASLAGLRCLSLALVLGLLAGPRLARRAAHRPSRPITVAVDTSRSMGLRGGLERSRLERVRDFLESGAYRRVAAGFITSYATFSESLKPLAPEGIGALTADGPRTDIARAAADASAAGTPAAVVLFSDGGHGAAAGADRALPDVPTVLVGVGAGEIVRDAEISSAESPAIAFVGQTLRLRVVVRAAGLAGRSVPLLLKRGKQVLVSRTVELPADGQDLETALEWTPPSAGGYPLAVEIPVQEGEQVAENNRAEVPIDVARDKIRVLLVSGAPSWSYRYLRAALKGDPSLDVVSFIILRSASDAVDVPQQELSLIPFPTQKIFMEELPNFDLLIFDNFASQPYLPSQYLDKIEEFVRGGGGFWMLGGPLSYLGGRYQQSALAPLLPVSLPQTPPPGGGFRDVPVQPRLTPAGRSHPFFQGLGSEPPALSGANVSGPARPGAVLLAEATLPGAQNQPLVVLGRHGRGRVLSVLTDSLWEWSFGESGRGRGNRAYLTFVRQAVRWSIGDPQLEPLRVEPDRPRLAPGDPIRARVRVLGEDFLPATDPGLSVRLRGPGGDTRALAATLEGPGVYRVEAPAPGDGSWEIVAEAATGGAVYARAAATVSVAWPPEEFRSPGLNLQALAALIAGRRGALLELDDHQRTAFALEQALLQLTSAAPDERAETRPLAEMLPAFLALLAVLAAEWLVRRRAGLD